MKLKIDPEVAKVAEFMTRNVPATHLQRVARALVQLGNLIWPEHYPDDPYYPIKLDVDAMEPSAVSQQPLTATLHHSLDCLSTPANDHDSAHK